MVRGWENGHGGALYDTARIICKGVPKWSGGA